jgi:hypothetical protein
MEGKRTGSASWIVTRRVRRGPSGPTPTAVSRPSPSSWAAPAIDDSHSAGDASNADSTCAAGRGTST